MFFFFPYATDAPIYHRPIATIGLIVANILVFLAVGGGPTEQNAHLWLAWGDGLHPLQWVSSNFVHGDFFHLAGNMIFLLARGGMRSRFNATGARVIRASSKSAVSMSGRSPGDASATKRFVRADATSFAGSSPPAMLPGPRR